MPTRPLEELRHAQAEKRASAELARVHHTMRLEDQALEQADLAAAKERLIAAYLNGNPRRLWDDT